MPLYLWCAVLLLALALAYASKKIGRESRLGRALWSFMPLILALPFASLSGMALDVVSGDPNITILTVPVFVAFSLLFEAMLNGRHRLKQLLPFFISCVIVGVIEEPSGLQKGYWTYSGIGSLIGVILMGYFLFFYFAIKMRSAIYEVVKK